MTCSPVGSRLIVFDNKLSITRSLQALVTNGELTSYFQLLLACKGMMLFGNGESGRCDKDIDSMIYW